MDEDLDKYHKQAGAQIFRDAIDYLHDHDWQGRTMDLLLFMTPNQTWPQPMAVHMYSALYNTLENQTLSQFDKSRQNKNDIIHLFQKVITELETE